MLCPIDNDKDKDKDNSADMSVRDCWAPMSKLLSVAMKVKQRKRDVISMRSN